MANDKNFLQNVVSEMKKVSWPTGQETVRYTAVVMFTVIFFLRFSMRWTWVSPHS
ncbi:preprotein translocase subunit SecE [Salinicoccus sp. CNSTN-B1]